MRKLLDKYSESVERHPVVWNVVCWSIVAGTIVAPFLAKERAAYKQMQRDVTEIKLEIEMANDILADQLGMNFITRGVGVA